MTASPFSGFFAIAAIIWARSRMASCGMKRATRPAAATTKRPAAKTLVRAALTKKVQRKKEEELSSEEAKKIQSEETGISNRRFSSTFIPPLTAAKAPKAIILLSLSTNAQQFFCDVVDI